jgi:hormone-sensitive lipase
MCVDIFSLSYLNAVTDPILSYNLLMFCINAYKGKSDDEIIKNPFFSPLFMSENVLKELPPIRIFGGTSDPLRDDSFYFMEKLLNLNKNVSMMEFKYFPHGFLNYDIKLIMPEAAEINQIVLEEMNKFIKEEINKK